MKGHTVELNLRHKNMGTLFFSALAGVGLTLAFPKAGLYGLAWFALVPLLWMIRDRSPKKSALAGLVFGLAHYLSLLYWILHVLHTYGYIPMVLCVPILALLALYLSLYPALFCFCLAKGCKRPAFLIVAAPALWVSLEFVRTHALSGFPWELLGYSQQPFMRIIQMADVTGVYGLSFLIVMVNTALFVLLAHGRKATWQGSRLMPRTVLIQAAATALCVFGALGYGELRVRQIDALAAVSPTLSVSVVQGNIDQSLKWTPAYQARTLEKYHELSARAAESSPDLIVWPETAAPFYFGHDKHQTLKLKYTVSVIDSEFLIGFPSFVQKKNRFEFYNSAHRLTRDGEIAGTYSKVHLVPFGEYVPLKSFLPFINKLTEQSGEFYPGKQGETLTLEKAVAGVQICFEVIFPGLSRAMVQNGAQILINMTNDAWFGRTSAPYQHFSMVTFRAVENRRAVARAANTGISGFIDPVGRTLAATGLYVDAEHTQSLPLLDIRTVYTRLGDLFAGLCVVLLGLFWFSRKKPDEPPAWRELK